MDKNFVLPKTEKSINLIIEKITRFFDISYICFAGLYGAYTIFRIFFMNHYFVLNVILATVSCTIFALALIEFLKKITLKRIVHIVFEILKRLLCLTVFVLSFKSLFSVNNELLPYNVLFTLFCGLGAIISIFGDIFRATIPAWSQIILDSFKSDIELSGLAARSFEQLKEELKNDEFKEKLASEAISAGSNIVRSIFKNFFKGSDKL